MGWGGRVTKGGGAEEGSEQGVEGRGCDDDDDDDESETETEKGRKETANRTYRSGMLTLRSNVPPS